MKPCVHLIYFTLKDFTQEGFVVCLGPTLPDLEDDVHGVFRDPIDEGKEGVSSKNLEACEGRTAPVPSPETK